MLCMLIMLSLSSGQHPIWIMSWSSSHHRPRPKGTAAATSALDDAGPPISSTVHATLFDTEDRQAFLIENHGLLLRIETLHRYLKLLREVPSHASQGDAAAGDTQSTISEVAPGAFVFEHRDNRTASTNEHDHDAPRPPSRSPVAPISDRSLRRFEDLVASLLLFEMAFKAALQRAAEEEGEETSHFMERVFYLSTSFFLTIHRSATTVIVQEISEMDGFDLFYNDEVYLANGNLVKDVFGNLVAAEGASTRIDDMLRVAAEGASTRTDDMLRVAAEGASTRIDDMVVRHAAAIRCQTAVRPSSPVSSSLADTGLETGEDGLTATNEGVDEISGPAGEQPVNEERIPVPAASSARPPSPAAPTTTGARLRTPRPRHGSQRPTTVWGGAQPYNFQLLRRANDGTANIIRRVAAGAPAGAVVAGEKSTAFAAALASAHSFLAAFLPPNTRGYSVAALQSNKSVFDNPDPVLNPIGDEDFYRTIRLKEILKEISATVEGVCFIKVSCPEWLMAGPLSPTRKFTLEIRVLSDMVSVEAGQRWRRVEERRSRRWADGGLTTSSISDDDLWAISEDVVRRTTAVLGRYTQRARRTPPPGRTSTNRLSVDVDRGRAGESPGPSSTSNGLIGEDEEQGAVLDDSIEENTSYRDADTFDIDDLLPPDIFRRIHDRRSSPTGHLTLSPDRRSQLLFSPDRTEQIVGLLDHSIGQLEARTDARSFVVSNYANTYGTRMRTIAGTSGSGAATFPGSSHTLHPVQDDLRGGEGGERSLPSSSSTSWQEVGGPLSLGDSSSVRAARDSFRREALESPPSLGDSSVRAARDSFRREALESPPSLGDSSVRAALDSFRREAQESGAEIVRGLLGGRGPLSSAVGGGGGTALTALERDTLSQPLLTSRVISNALREAERGLGDALSGEERTSALRNLRTIASELQTVAAGGSEELQTVAAGGSSPSVGGGAPPTVEGAPPSVGGTPPALDTDSYVTERRMRIERRASRDAERGLGDVLSRRVSALRTMASELQSLSSTTSPTGVAASSAPVLGGASSGGRSSPPPPRAAASPSRRRGIDSAVRNRSSGTEASTAPASTAPASTAPAPQASTTPSSSDSYAPGAAGAFPSNCEFLELWRQEERSALRSVDALSEFFPTTQKLDDRLELVLIDRTEKVDRTLDELRKTSDAVRDGVTGGLGWRDETPTGVTGGDGVTVRDGVTGGLGWRDETERGEAETGEEGGVDGMISWGGRELTRFEYSLVQELTPGEDHGHVGQPQQGRGPQQEQEQDEVVRGGGGKLHRSVVELGLDSVKISAVLNALRQRSVLASAADAAASGVRAGGPPPGSFAASFTEEWFFSAPPILHQHRMYGRILQQLSHAVFLPEAGMLERVLLRLFRRGWSQTQHLLWRDVKKGLWFLDSVFLGFPVEGVPESRGEFGLGQILVSRSSVAGRAEEEEKMERMRESFVQYDPYAAFFRHPRAAKVLGVGDTSGQRERGWTGPPFSPSEAESDPGAAAPPAGPSRHNLPSVASKTTAPGCAGGTGAARQTWIPESAIERANVLSNLKSQYRQVVNEEWAFLQFAETVLGSWKVLDLRALLAEFLDVRQRFLKKERFGGIAPELRIWGDWDR